MKKHILNLLKLLIIIVICIVIYLLGILIINTVNDYKPEGGIYELGDFQKYDQVTKQDTLSVVTWNIGYAGLGKDADFFYDGGKMSRPAKIEYNGYWDGIQEYIKTFNTVEFILFQEVDTTSSRSYGNNQLKKIAAGLKSHTGLFTKNYDVSFVPMPVFDPMGRVVSGISFFTSKKPSASYWGAFDGNQSWPLGLFMPDRCYSINVFDISLGEKLYIINTHNSAFDDGSLRNSQLELLYKLMDSLYQEGHYVIAGGDWNLNPTTYSNEVFISGDRPFELSGQQVVSGPDSDWQVVFDPGVPTNRDVSTPYTSGQTPTTIVDFFVCSPNIQVLEIKTMYLGFEYTDHHPVYLQFSLN